MSNDATSTDTARGTTAPATEASIKIVALLLLVVSVFQIGSGIVSAVVPIRLADSGLPPSAVGWVTSTFSVGFLIGCIAASRMINALGAFRSIVAFAFATAAATLLLLVSVQHDDVGDIARAVGLHRRRPAGADRGVAGDGGDDENPGHDLRHLHGAEPPHVHDRPDLTGDRRPCWRGLIATRGRHAICCRHGWRSPFQVRRRRSARSRDHRRPTCRSAHRRRLRRRWCTVSSVPPGRRCCRCMPSPAVSTVEQMAFLLGDDPARRPDVPDPLLLHVRPLRPSHDDGGIGAGDDGTVARVPAAARCRRSAG